jgi:glutathione S-transferase
MHRLLDSGTTTTATEPGMTALTLVGYTTCPFTQRANIALREHGVTFDVVFLGGGEKPDWFDALSPTGRVPVLRVERAGRPVKALFESGALQELAEDIGPVKLHPADPFERAEHRAWIDLAAEMLADSGRLSMVRTGDELAPLRAALDGKLKRLEGAASAEGPYFAGAAFSNIDIALAPLFVRLAILERTTAVRFGEALARVDALRAALLARPSVVQSQAPGFETDYLAWLRGRGSALLQAA